MPNMVGYHLSIVDTGGAIGITGPNGTGADGPIDLLISTPAAGVYVGDSAVAGGLPNSGYELVAGQEYRFTLPGDGLYVATTSTTYVTLQVFVSPHIA